jgi:hypothetical protein
MPLAAPKSEKKLPLTADGTINPFHRFEFYLRLDLYMFGAPSGSSARSFTTRMAEIVQWLGPLVVAEETWVRFPVSA